MMIYYTMQVFLNFEKRINIGSDFVEYFVSRYPHLHGLTVPKEMELLQEEFVCYQLLNDSDIPTDIWDAVRVGEDDNTYTSIGIYPQNSKCWLI